MKRCVVAFTLTLLLVSQAAIRAATANELSRNEPVELLVSAAAQGDLGSVSRLLAARTDPNAVSKSISRALPLVQAAANGHGGVVSALLQAGAAVDARDGRGQRALVVAAYHGRLDVCRQLLAAGARVDSATDDELAVLVAGVMSGNVAITELLLQAGALPTHIDRAGRNALLVASDIGNETTVAILLNAISKQVGSDSRDLLLTARDAAAQAKHAIVVTLISQRITP